LTRKIKFIIATLFTTGLLFLFPSNKAHADDTAVVDTTSQPVLDPSVSIENNSTITINSVQNKIDSATSTLQSTAQIDSAAIINSIQTNVPNADTQTAVQIATTQDPISTAVQDATLKIQIANQAIDSATSAIKIVNSNQLVVDSQTVIVSNIQLQIDSATANVDSTTTTLQSAQNTLSSAPLSTINVTASGVIATVYRAQNGASPSLNNLGNPVETLVVPSISYNWGSGQILNSGLSDHVIVVFNGQITVPNTTDIYYAVYSDDGSKLYINGQLIINNWRDQGLTWSPYSQHFTVTPGQTQDITLYYYENGGGAGVTMGWGYNNIWTSPTSVNYSHVTSTTSAPNPALVQAVTDAQKALNDAQNNLNTTQQQLSEAINNLATAQNNLQISLQTANALADTATVAVQTAVTAMDNSVQVTNDYYAQIAAAKAATDALAAQQAADRQAALKAAADAAAAKAQADALAAQQAADKAAADKAAADAAAAKAQADAKAAQDAADAKAKQDAADAAAKAAQDAANAKAEADAKLTAQQAADQAAKDAQAKATADKAAADAAKAQADKVLQDAIGVKPNNPDQLSDTVVKEAPAELLVPHIQVDLKGVENGGIQFFGTKSAPQVVGEDGNLTPPAPPPGSGLPIPADAITTADTFIGQPGGASFNAPDVAVPVVLTPVTGALAAVPGVQAINQTFVAMANIGNDMSPVTRKKAKKILVTTVVVGQIVALRRRFGK